MITVETILLARMQQKEKNDLRIKDFTSRSVELNEIKPLPEFAKIITGVRRCGKSTLVQMLLKDSSFYINFEDTTLYGFTVKDFPILDEAIAQFVKENGKCKYLCFDEIQSVEGWEVYVHQKLDEGFLVVVTGSNASLLSSELGTRLTGRHLDLEMFPFSFSEFCSFKKLNQNVSSFSKYLEKGGFPEFLKTGSNEILQNLFDDILVRDIAVRNSIRDIRTLKVLAL